MSNSTQVVKLGNYVKDIVTGIEGTAIGKTEWLTGCDTIHVEPKPTTQGEKQSGITLDITRVKFLNDGVRAEFFPEEFSKPKPVKKEKTGGPHDNIQPARVL